LTQDFLLSTKMIEHSSLRHEQALLTRQLANTTIAGTSAFVDVAF
jgi:hypothetical protein